MRRNIRAAGFALLLLASPVALAAKKDNRANKETVERRLIDHFPLTQWDAFRGPGRVGAVVELLKPGLEAYPSNAVTPAFNYKGGFLRKTSATSLLTQPFLPLPQGTRLVIVRIEAHENFVGFEVVTAAPVNGIWFKSAVHFDYGHGYLDAPDFARIELNAAEVFGLQRERSRPPQQRPAPSPPPITDPPPPPPPPPGPPSEPPPVAAKSRPVDLKTGMSPTQVRSAMGEPSRVIRLGSKEIFVYESVKVTLANGKVTNIE